MEMEKVCVCLCVCVCAQMLMGEERKEKQPKKSRREGPKEEGRPVGESAKGEERRAFSLPQKVTIDFFGKRERKKGKGEREEGRNEGKRKA